MNFRLRTNFRNLEPVKKNLKKVSDVVNFNYENIVRPDYNHSNNIEIIKKLDDGERPSLSGKSYENVDGLITNMKNIPIMSTNADCNLILLYDPINKIIGNVHAGWRGTFDKIAQNAIIKMKEVYKCDSKNIICCFCPSIRVCHFEVDEDVANECKKIFEDFEKLNEIVIMGEIKSGKQKYYIDTVRINKILLMQEGILEKNIIDSEICSICNKDKIHSRRAEGEDFELACALIEIK